MTRPFDPDEIGRALRDGHRITIGDHFEARVVEAHLRMRCSSCQALQGIALVALADRIGDVFAFMATHLHGAKGWS